MTESTIGLKKLEDFRMTREKIEAEKEAMERASKDDAERQKKYAFLQLNILLCFFLQLYLHLYLYLFLGTILLSYMTMKNTKMKESNLFDDGLWLCLHFNTK